MLLEKLIIRKNVNEATGATKAFIIILVAAFCIGILVWSFTL